MGELELSETLEWTGIKAERGVWMDFELLYRLWVTDACFSQIYGCTGLAKIY